MPVFSLSGKRPNNLGVQGNRLTTCPPSPNCVCSDDRDAAHGIVPFTLAVPPEQAWEAARRAVMRLPRTSIVSEAPRYLRAECKSALFGFVDDLELHLRGDTAIAVRSASRVGHSDFGVNRKRVEQLRGLLRAGGTIR
jgi:uncharacterized protein (DUF1499 family)